MNQDAPQTGRYVNLLFGLALLFGLYLTSLYSYLLFHSLAEIFSIVVACGIFVIAWNSRLFVTNNYLLFIGIAFLFIGGMDLLHTLAYTGMGVFPGADTNLPTQLWIAARYLEAASLLIAPAFIRRRLRSRVIFLGFGIVFSILVASIFYFRIFPDCFIEGAGLTWFKKISEYIICFILLISLAFLFQRRSYFDPAVLRLLMASIIITIGAELAFTFYINAYSFSNLIGHFLKILSFYLIYKAFIETGLMKPYTLLFRDLKKREEELQSANQKMKELELLKEDLTNMIVHDMKNPVTNTMLALDLIGMATDDQLSEKRHEFIPLAKRNQLKLSEMITNLLEISKLESGHMQVNNTLIDLEALVNRNVERYTALLEAEDQTVRIQFDPDSKKTFSDEILVERIFSNMLSNAIQHSAEGGEILVTAAPSKDQGGISISVEDFGEGIPREYHERIFEKFSQVGLRREGRKAGTGLGLAFCRMAAEALGGTISIESTPGKGSRFSLLLPEAPRTA